MISSPRIVSLTIIAILLLCPTALFAVPTEYQPNFDRGYETGYKLGYKSGFGTGKLRGIEEGTSAGTSNGHTAGWDDAYQPAFDRAYDHFYRIGRTDGWNEGVVNGFDEGVAWATKYLETVSNGIFAMNSVSISTFNFPGAWFGNPGSPRGTNTGMHGSGLVLTSGGLNLDYDWAAHYFLEGQREGREVGLEIGSTEGYDLAYPRAYKNSYRIGYGSGKKQGKSDGTTEGTEEGLDEGWDFGFDIGHEQGFSAGADYLFYGTYALSPPAWVQGSLGQGAAGVPEPGSVILAIAAGILACCRCRSRR